MAPVNAHPDACSKSVLLNLADGAIVSLDRPTQSRQAYAELDGVPIELPIFFEVDENDGSRRIDLPIWAQWIKKTPKKFKFRCSTFEAKDAKEILTKIQRPLHRDQVGPAIRLLPNTNWGRCTYFNEQGEAFGCMFS